MHKKIIYFTDTYIDMPPEDCKLLVYLAPLENRKLEGTETLAYEYWTLTPGESVQMYVTEFLLGTEDASTWRLITNNPKKYTTLIAKKRFLVIRS